MGLFSSLKNFVTGGGAEVTLELDGQARRGSSLGIRITAVAGESDVELEHVSVKVQATESVEIPNVEVAKTVNDVVRVEERKITHQEKTFVFDTELGSALKLKAGETHSWEAQVDIPEDALPTFTGKNARHSWRVIAALDVRGNDPDTGWVDFEVG